MSEQITLFGGVADEETLQQAQAAKCEYKTVEVSVKVEFSPNDQRYYYNYSAGTQGGGGPADSFDEACESIKGRLIGVVRDLLRHEHKLPKFRIHVEKLEGKPDFVQVDFQPQLRKVEGFKLKFKEGDRVCFPDGDEGVCYGTVVFGTENVQGILHGLMDEPDYYIEPDTCMVTWVDESDLKLSSEPYPVGFTPEVKKVCKTCGGRWPEKQWRWIDHEDGTSDCEDCYYNTPCPQEEKPKVIKTIGGHPIFDCQQVVFGEDSKPRENFLIVTLQQMKDLINSNYKLVEDDETKKYDNGQGDKAEYFENNLNGSIMVSLEGEGYSNTYWFGKTKHACVDEELEESVDEDEEESIEQPCLG